MSLELVGFEDGLKNYLDSIRSGMKKIHLRRAYEQLRKISEDVKLELQIQAAHQGQNIDEEVSDESDVEYPKAEDAEIVPRSDFDLLMKKYDRVMDKYFSFLPLTSRRTYALSLSCAVEVPPVLYNQWIP
ncbi:uncharacterized protein LOC135840742 [Planococcus citri]|uniref:uncharacterized protein LOC135840742 n=1 Tax=Planococcus citri TaxID=170843 RepID=UPI0031F939ED